MNPKRDEWEEKLLAECNARRDDLERFNGVAGFFNGAIWAREQTIKEVLEHIFSMKDGWGPPRVMAERLEKRFLSQQKDKA